VGAGTWLFTRKFAAEVGDTGKVYAVDIAPTFLQHIEKTCQDAKIKNVVTILCDQVSTKLPKNSVDLVFICDTYHHFEFPQRTLQSIHDALRPGGQIILIDFQRIEGKSSEWILGHVRAGKEVFVREITSTGFKVIGEETLLKENYLLSPATAGGDYQATSDAPGRQNGFNDDQGIICRSALTGNRNWFWDPGEPYWFDPAHE
jgi:ubiquinone/menaquinone biosynthesis C-methylase UbiE